MAHELENMFYFGQTPWHGLGTEVSEAPTSDKALVVAGLDWIVKLQNMYVYNHGYVENGKLEPRPQVIEDYSAVVRQSDASILGIVRGRYEPIQNHECFSFMDALLGDGLVYETAGSLQKGKKVWMTAKLPNYELLGDDTAQYIVMMNAHDGSSSARVLLTPIRVVCMNTLNFALNTAVRAVKIRHTGDIQEKINEAKRILSISNSYKTALQKEAEVLAGIKVNDDQIQKIVETILPIPDSDKADQAKKNIELQRYQVWERLKVDNLANHRNNTWGVINAVADFADHVVTVKKPTIRTKELHFERIVIGHDLLDKTYKVIKQLAA